MESMGGDEKAHMESDGDGWCGCQAQDSIEALQHAMLMLRVARGMMKDTY